MRKYRGQKVEEAQEMWGTYNVTAYTDQDYQGEFNLLYAERELMCKALIRTNGNQEKARKLMGVTDKKFYVAMKRHGLRDFLNEVKKDQL